MKFKSYLLIPIVAVLLLPAVAHAQPKSGPLANPAVGLPPVVDPTTGQPVAQGIPDWKDPNWKDPDIVLTNVSYFDGMPLTEVIRNIRDSFRGQFDILTPANWGNNPYTPPPVDASTGQILPTVGSGQVDLAAIPVTLELKNVTASELFNAMNLIFENDRTPLRWELRLNGKRQVALLRVLADPSPQVLSTARPAPVIRRVYFVGDLIGDDKNGGMTMDQIIATVQDVWKTTYNEPAALKFHKDAQLLIVSGTPDQITFVEDILNALKQKAALARQDPQARARDAQQIARLRELQELQKQSNAPKTTDLKPAGK